MLTQTKYASEILQDTNMINSKPVGTPIDCTPLKAKNKEEQLRFDAPFNATIYCQSVGILQYLCITCPNLSFVVSRVAQHMH